MGRDFGYNRTRQIGTWIFLTLVIMVVTSFVVLSALHEVAYPFGYFPFFFFGWWIFIPVFFFVAFFLLLRCWGWGNWWRSGWYYDSAMEIVSQRFARGEITKDQYVQMRKELEGAS
jgi:uncharacterized membrane protein